MSYTSTCPITYTKKCNELKVGVGTGVLNFLDEGGGIMKIKVLRLSCDRGRL